MSTNFPIVNSSAPRTAAAQGQQRMWKTIVLCACIVVSSTAVAEDCITKITNAATKACAIPPMEGSRQSVDLSAEAKLRANKLLKSVADAGIELGGKYRSETYKGLLAEQLAADLQNARACTQNIIKMLKPACIGEPPASAPKALPEKVSLTPGKDTSQDAACGKGAEQKGLQVLLGGNAFFAPPGDSLTVIQMDGSPVVWVKPDDNGWHGVFANIFRSDGQLLAKLQDSELVPMRKAYGLKVDESRLPHSLRLLGPDNKEILVVDYLSEKTMRIRGTFFVKGVPSDIQVREKEINMFGTKEGVFDLAGNCFEQPVALDLARVGDQLSVLIGGAIRFRIPIPEASSLRKQR